MATRITHTNNSDGHDGTYVYRSTSPMDPQDLPEPIADAPPVALGAVFEYIDTPAPGATYHYRTQDHEGGQVSTVSDKVSILVPDDFSEAQVGDEIGGGIYAGTITYADSREFHLVFTKQEGEADPAVVDTRWKTTDTTTSGTTDPDDGAANVNAMIADGIENHPAAQYCVNLDVGGRSDWSLPAINELEKAQALIDADHPEFQTGNSGFENIRWSSTENDATQAKTKRFSDGFSSVFTKSDDRARIRPVRRVAV